MILVLYNTLYLLLNDKSIVINESYARYSIKTIQKKSRGYSTLDSFDLNIFILRKFVTIN
jgi:hypothetical protein